MDKKSLNEEKSGDKIQYAQEAREQANKEGTLLSKEAKEVEKYRASIKEKQSDTGKEMREDGVNITIYCKFI